mgnify:CR=1 FL=1|jgi:16S rRNA (cytidine1402-2'-O)-methyltransferase
MQTGKLCVVSTPIGNLKDITLRAIETLKISDLILAEDTRVTQKLLNHYQIKNRLLSYHKFNEKKCISEVITELENGKIVSLVSDAGTPLFSDPGFILIEECLKRKIKIEVIPGPSSITAALILSGFNPERFYFYGFLPKKNKEKELEDLKKFNCPVVLFESPLRIKSTLMLILEKIGDCRAAVIKEITKIYEQVFYGKISQLLAEITDDKLKGEFVIVFLPEKENPDTDNQIIDERIKNMLKLNLPANEIAKKLAIELKLKKNIIYKRILDIKRGE